MSISQKKTKATKGNRGSLRRVLRGAGRLLLRADELNRDDEVSAPLHTAMFFLAVAGKRVGKGR